MRLGHTLEEKTDRIWEALESQGPHWHNLISACLRNISRKYGWAEANRIVDELNIAIGTEYFPKHVPADPWEAIKSARGKE